jgi:hypothetical protein
VNLPLAPLAASLAGHLAALQGRLDQAIRARSGAADALLGAPTRQVVRQGTVSLDLLAIRSRDVTASLAVRPLNLGFALLHGVRAEHAHRVSVDVVAVPQPARNPPA